MPSLERLLSEARQLAIEFDSSHMSLCQAIVESWSMNGTQFLINGRVVLEFDDSYSFGDSTALNAEGKEVNIYYVLATPKDCDRRTAEIVSNHFTPVLKLAERCFACLSISRLRRLGFRSSGSKSAAWFYYVLATDCARPSVARTPGFDVLPDPLLATVQTLQRLIAKKARRNRVSRVIIPRSISVQLQPPQVVIDGQAIAVSADGATLVNSLLDARGEWVSGESLGMRADKVKKKLPLAIRDLIQAEPGKGQRIVASAEPGSAS